jgi:two-component sensor histidine kinase
MQMGLNSEDADMTMPSGTETSRPPVPTTRDELLYRLRQQSLLGEFGRAALQTRDLRQILQRATELCAQGLEAPFAKVLEYIPDEKRLLVRAGVGWPAGTIDHVSLGADVESPAGYAFHAGTIVISNHLQEETRFRTPRFLADRGIRRAINVLIARGEGHLPFGVLEVDSADPGQFDPADADFLAGFAGLLGIAIERQQADAELQASLDHQAMLTREMSHRVKNSLASVVGLLRVQSRNAQSEDVQNALKDAASRITTIAQVHDHLWRSKQIGFVDIADFASELCNKLQETSPGHKLHCKFGNLMISADKAIPLGLLINELVTNAAKHAYPGGSGEIHVSGEQRGEDLHVEVSDQGIGLPKDFDIDQPRASLGFKVIKSLLGQLDGRITVSSNQPKGATIQLDLPLDLPS